MTLVVMRDAFDVAQFHGQRRLRALQRLALALFINTQHQRVVRRPQVQAYHVA